MNKPLSLEDTFLWIGRLAVGALIAIGVWFLERHVDAEAATVQALQALTIRVERMDERRDSDATRLDSLEASFRALATKEK